MFVICEAVAEEMRTEINRGAILLRPLVCAKPCSSCKTTNLQCSVTAFVLHPSLVASFCMCQLVLLTVVLNHLSLRTKGKIVAKKLTFRFYFIKWEV